MPSNKKGGKKAKTWYPSSGSADKGRNKENKATFQALPAPRSPFDLIGSSLPPPSPPNKDISVGYTDVAMDDGSGVDGNDAETDRPTPLNVVGAAQVTTTINTIATDIGIPSGPLPFSIHSSPASAPSSDKKRPHEMSPETARHAFSSEAAHARVLRQKRQQQQNDSRLFKDLTNQQLSPSTTTPGGTVKKPRLHPAYVAGASATTTATTNTITINGDAAAAAANGCTPLATVQTKTENTGLVMLPATETAVAVITSPDGGEVVGLVTAGGEQYHRAVTEMETDGFRPVYGKCFRLPSLPMALRNTGPSPPSSSRFQSINGDVKAAAGPGKDSRSPTVVETSPSGSASPQMAVAASWSPSGYTPFASIVCSDVYVFLVGSTEIGQFSIHRAALAGLSSPQLKKTLALGRDTRTVRLRSVEPDIFALFSEWAYTREYTAPEPKGKPRTGVADSPNTCGIHYWGAPDPKPAAPKKADPFVPIPESIRSSRARLGRDPSACRLCGEQVAWLPRECRECKGPAVAPGCLNKQCARSLAAGEPECHAPGSWCQRAAERDSAAGTALKMRQMKLFSEGSALLPAVDVGVGCWDDPETGGGEDDGAKSAAEARQRAGLVNGRRGSSHDTDEHYNTKDGVDHDDVDVDESYSVGGSSSSSAGASDGSEDGLCLLSSATARGSSPAVAPENSWGSLYAHPHPQAAVFRPRAGAYAAEGFGNVLVAHARLYALASRWGADTLRRLALHKLWQTLCCFPLHPARLARDTVALVRFVFHGTEAIAPGAGADEDCEVVTTADTDADADASLGAGVDAKASGGGGDEGKDNQEAGMGAMGKTKGKGKGKEKDKVKMMAAHRDLLRGLVLDFCACALEEMDAGGALDKVMANAEVVRGLMKRTARRFA